MNAFTTSFRLLILNRSQEEAQRLSSMFHNAGRSCRAQYITSLAALDKIIEEQKWDLLIAGSESDSPSVPEAIRSIRKHNQDIPVIILNEGDSGRSIIDGMKSGAEDVVQLDDDQHLLLVVSRELKNREHRKIARIAERRAKELEKHNQLLLDSSKDGIAFIQDGTFIYSNQSFAEMCGYTHRSDIEYLPLMDLVASEDQVMVKKTLKQFALQSSEQVDQQISFLIKNFDGQFNPIDVSLRFGRFEEEDCLEFFIHAEVTDSEILEAEIKSIRYTDSTTGLHNKLSFNNFLTDCIDKCLNQGKAYCLLYLDLDKFKTKVEGVVGLDGAVNVLIAVKEFLEAHCSPEDFIARVADDSFAIVTEETTVENIVALGNKICESIREYFFEVDNKTIRLTTSIGVTYINDTVVDPQSAINQTVEAIESLRHANKYDKGDGVNFYQIKEDDKTILVTSLQEALNDNRLRLLFQPIISLKGDDIEYYEVLLRMLDEQGNEISPNNFLKTAESMKANCKIDRWVLLEAIKHLSNLDKSHSVTKLIIHISHHSICDDTLLGWLNVAFQAAKVEPSCIVLQASESNINDHLTASKQFIEKASSLGLSFCLNHFGCSLDQMAILDMVNVGFIKVDPSFTKELQENSNNSEAIETLINNLQEREKTIIVPSVESPTILSILWRLGVHCIQGNYLQAPSAAMDYDFGLDA